MIWPEEQGDFHIIIVSNDRARLSDTIHNSETSSLIQFRARKQTSVCLCVCGVRVDDAERGSGTQTTFTSCTRAKVRKQPCKLTSAHASPQLLGKISTRAFTGRVAHAHICTHATTTICAVL